MSIKIEKEGDGVHFAKKGDKVTVAYDGRLTDNISFDKSDNFKFRVGLGEVIKGWD